MRNRLVTLVSIALVSTAALALEPQSPIDWPPKAVPNQQKGKVLDFTADNQLCLDCHKAILDVKTGRKDIPNLHRRHLESKKIAYGGANRSCLTCHDMVTPVETKGETKEGWFVAGNVSHPNVLQDPRALWKKLVVRSGEGAQQYLQIEALRQQDPDLFKPTLGRLVCAQCHGPESLIKTFYGAPATQ